MLPGPEHPDALTSTVDWAQSLIFGAFGNVLATISVAWLGFEMLSGRVSMKSAGRVVLGIFILFGAKAIAQELRGLASEAGENRGQVVFLPAPGLPPPRLPAPPSQNPDPYAGASVPM